MYLHDSDGQTALSHASLLGMHDLVIEMATAGEVPTLIGAPRNSECAELCEQPLCGLPSWERMERGTASSSTARLMTVKAILRAYLQLSPEHRCAIIAAGFLASSRRAHWRAQLLNCMRWAVAALEESRDERTLNPTTADELAGLSTQIQLCACGCLIALVHSFVAYTHEPQEVSFSEAFPSNTCRATTRTLSSSASAASACAMATAGRRCSWRSRAVAAPS